jgi:hypothetical protein
VAGDFEIGDGYVKVTTRVDDKAVHRDADKAGDEFQDTFTKAVEKGGIRNRGRLAAVWRRTGAATSDGFYKGADGRWRDSENRFVASGNVTGRRFGTRMVQGVVSGLGGLVKGVLGMFSGLRGAIGPMVGPLGAIAPLLSILLPLLAKGSVAVYNFGAAFAAAAPLILGVGLQVAAVKAIVGSFAPAIGKALNPMTEAFKAAHKEATAFAVEGLEPLANEFVTRNMGAIRTMLSSIAATTNGVVRGFLEWTNTNRGVIALGNIMQGIQSLAERIAPAVQGVAISFVAMAGRISEVTAAAGGNGLSYVLNKINGYLDGITAESVTSGLDRLKSNFVAIGNAMRSTVEFGQMIWAFYQRFRTEIQATVDVLGILAIAFGGPVTATVAAVGMIIRHWDQVKALLATARSWFGGIEGGSQIVERLRGVVDQVWAALQRAFFTIRSAVEGPLRELGRVLQEELFPALGNLLVAIGPLIPILIDRLAPAIGTAIAGFIRMVTFAARVVAAVANFAARTGEHAKTVREKFTSFLEFFRSLPGKIGNAIRSIPGVIGNILQTAATRALFLIGYLVGRVIREIAKLPGRIRSGISAIPGIVSTLFTNAGNRARSGATSLVNGAVRFLRTLPGKARSAIAGTPGRIKSVFSGAGSWLVSAGRNILMGLVNGMKGAVGSAVDAAVGAARATIGGLKKGLGINSPSKVAEQEVGRWVMPGVTRGIEKTLPAETRKINTMTPSVATSAAAGTVTAPSTTNSSSVDIANLNVNVKGVLDPSDPVAMRRMIAAIYEELAKYERSYA